MSAATSELRTAFSALSTGKITNARQRDEEQGWSHTDMVLDGNRQLTRVTQQAAHLKGDPAAAAGVLSEIKVVVGVLDELLNLAAAFH